MVRDIPRFIYEVYKIPEGCIRPWAIAVRFTLNSYTPAILSNPLPERVHPKEFTSSAGVKLPPSGRRMIRAALASE